MANGLLINRQLVSVPDVKVVGPREVPWNYLPDGDSRPRTAGDGSPIWCRQWFLHKTIADDPEVIEPGAGPSDGAQRTITGWQREWAQTIGAGKYRGAALVTSHDGVVYQLVDLALTETFHATVSNPYSVGQEVCELPGGKSYQAAMDSTVACVITGCEAMGIQLQMPKLGSYTGHPITRMLHGGPDMVGVFGHRDNTEERGRWDPGDELFEMLAQAGVEQFDFAAGEDRKVWSERQTDLNAMLGKKLGKPLTCDGVPGPATRAALALAGYRSGIYALGMA